jgi:hypothetical protein
MNNHHLASEADQEVGGGIYVAASSSSAPIREEHLMYMCAEIG